MFWLIGYLVGKDGC